MSCFLPVLLALSMVVPQAHADIEQGIGWLDGRETADGVHRSSDLANASDTNGESWLTLKALSRDGGFVQLAGLVQTQDDGTLLATARRAYIRLEQGQSAASELSELLGSQSADGGFPSRKAYQSEPLTTAWVLAALDRAGQGAGTPANRALGYLITAQHSGGGWLSAPGNAPSVFATAQVARMLAPFRNRFDLTVPLSRARTYLISAAGPQNHYGESFVTALALDGLLALGVERQTLQPIAAGLQSLQSGNGSFADDAYVTALALRALWRFAQPELPPAQAAITGRVLAADTQLPIAGATLALIGTSTASLVSNNLGRLQSNTLPGGSYQASLSYTGMRTITFELTLIDGRTLDLGDLRMVQGTSPDGQFGIIRGLVTSSETGLAIGGVRIQLMQPPVQVIADADGRYQLLQVPVGPVTISAEATGFSSRTVELTMAPLTTIDFSLQLTPLPASSSLAEVRGTVTHGQTNAPLAGVTIAVTAGAAPVSVQTDPAGNYTLQVEPGALVTLVAQAPDFDEVSIRAPLVANEVLLFSPRMYPTGQTPVGANRSEIRGVVVNQANRLPLERALIIVSDPSGQQSIRSDANGAFRITGLSGPVTQLSFSADAFEPASLLVPIQPLEVRDIGQVGLKPTTVSFYFPDLVITDSSLSTTEPDNFSLADQFAVQVANGGTSAVTQDFSLLAFVDANGNGQFDSAVEPEVGRVRVTDDLPIGNSVAVDIAVTAQLSFRDAPIAFWVDAESEVPEQDEQNNTGSSLLGCRVTPALISADNVFEVWRWSGLSSNPLINSLNQTPVVVQLTDDNNDGVINEYDIPDLAFVAGLRDTIQSQTALVAISGDDGRELWSVNSPFFSHFSSMAAGDIDNDGVAEIIAVRGYRQALYAFENDGTVKWQTPLTGPGIPRVDIPPPPYNYDAPIIVNLEGDNEAEIILGRQAFRGHTGEKLWEGEFDAGGDGGKPIDAPLAVAFGQAAIAADINMDGVVEVLAGRSLYDFAGRTLWHRADIKPVPYSDAIGTPMNHSGHNALGNFDLDDFPEIVLTIQDEMYLLEHTGETIWGPKFAPDFSIFGAPTVGDIDADGLPEIIAASQTRLTVYETDGTVKWTAEIDDSSTLTGVTFFDFQDDGLYEIVHMDEEDLRIFDALTGTRLFEKRNFSVTVNEYPIVADIDGDKQAEIVVTSADFDFVAGTTPGVRAFKARNGAWADAGSVWGSHAFHVSEVNEDSTVPLLETPSWLTHNTYRAQRSPLPDPLGMPDFSVGDLRLIDQGPGLDPVVQVRVGNAGPVDAHEPGFIGIYRGDPAAGGVLLREIRMDTLRPARFQVVNLGTIPLAGNGELYAVADQRGKARECREDNNQRVIPFAATNGLGDLQLASDQPSYRPGDAVRFTAAVANQGALTAGFRVEWFVRNAQNQVTAQLSPVQLDSVVAGQTDSRDLLWPSSGVLAGNYVLVGRLYNAAGTQIDTATLAFAIAGDASGPAGGVSLSTYRSEYAPGELIQLNWRARNLSASEVIRLPEVVISVSGPGGFNTQQSFPLSDLFAGAAIDGELTVDGAVLAGGYQATARLRSRLTSFEYAVDTTEFIRLLDLSSQIEGVVQVARPSLTIGETQTCLFSARNRGTVAQSNVSLRKRVVGLDSTSVRFEQVFSTDLTPGIDNVSSEALNTASYGAEEHTCLLEVEGPGGWRILDSQPFVLLGLPDAAILVEPIAGLVTSEAGQSAQFSVRLSRAPSADVVVPLQSSDTTEWSLPVSELQFSVASWDVPRQVTVLGVDDDLVDGDQSGTILVLPAQSADTAYQALDPADVSISNLDDDSVMMRVSPLAIETSESGTTAQFEVSLNAAPSADVRIALSSSDLGEWSLSTSELVFTPANGVLPLTVVVTGVDDAELDGVQTGQILLAPAQSTDPRYAGMDPPDVVARNLDNDGPVIEVDPIVVVTSEAGTAGSFTVRLGAVPTAEVVIPIGVVDTTEWQVLDTEIRLNPGNWQAGYTVQVTPVNDSEVDGDQSATLLLGAALSADSRYQGIDPTDVELTNLDDDAAQILVDPTSGLIVNEDGASDTFTISLTVPPTETVTVALSSSDATEFAVSPATVSFDPTDFSPRTVTVTGLDDAVADGNIAGLIITAAAVSADTRYAGINPPNVGVTNLDNEVVQITVTPEGSIETSEDGTQATITLRLSAAPSADVSIALVNPDPSEWSLDASELRFTPANWSTPQVLTVTGVNDLDIDGDQFAVIGLGAAVSADPLYAGLDPIDVPAVNRDNDVPVAILVSPEGNLVTSETGTTASFSVRLSTEPAASVSVALSNPDPSEWMLDRSVVVFDPADWSTPRVVIITGIDDSDPDGDVQGQITLAPAVSTDPRFDGINPRDVPVINLDDEVISPPLWVIDPVDLLVAEAGDGGGFRVSLSRAPTAPVQVGVVSANSAEVLVAPSGWTFGANNWSTPQLVVLGGIDDFIDDGDQVVEVRVSVLSSADPAFASMAPANLMVTNLDNDQASVTLRLTGPDQIIEGQSTTLALQLGSQPTAPLTLFLQANLRAPGVAGQLDYQLIPVQIQLQPSQWQQAQPLTLRTTDNRRINPNQIVDVQLVQIESADPLYVLQMADPVAVQVRDRGAEAVPVPVNRVPWLLLGLLVLSGGWVLVGRGARP